MLYKVKNFGFKIEAVNIVKGVYRLLIHVGHRIYFSYFKKG